MTAIDTSTKAVERLLENVTPGPWQAETCEDYITEYGFERLLITSEAGVSVVEGCGCCGSPFGKNVRDTHFIAAARDLIPALLKERDDLRAKLDAAVGALQDALLWTADNQNRTDWRGKARAALRAIGEGEA